MTQASEIVRKIRQGDIREFESLFRSSYTSLVKYANSFVKDQDSAEEIVQDLFFRLWQERKKLNIKSSLTGYLFRAVHNRCLHYIGHLKVVERHSMEMSAGNHPVSPEADQALNLRELQDKIAAVLERLPERCGKIFCMNRFDGLKYSEIAEKLSVSVKTVEACMGKALKEFRKILSET